LFPYSQKVQFIYTVLCDLRTWLKPNPYSVLPNMQNENTLHISCLVSQFYLFTRDELASKKSSSILSQEKMADSPPADLVAKLRNPASNLCCPSCENYVLTRLVVQIANQDGCRELVCECYTSWHTCILCNRGGGQMATSKK
jgi:hypothetical protein